MLETCDFKSCEFTNNLHFSLYYGIIILVEEWGDLFMNKNKMFMIVCVCILCISVIGSAIAFYTQVLFNDFDVNTITHGLDYYINYAKGTDITSTTLSASSDYSGGTSAEIELWKVDNTYDIYGHIYLDVEDIGTNVSNSSALKYAVVNNDIVIAEGSLKGSNAGDSILLKNNILLETTKQLYEIYVWIDQNEELDVAADDESISLTVRCEATMKAIADTTS